MQREIGTNLGKSAKEREATSATIASLYLSGISSSELGKRFGVRSYYIAQYVLKPAGIKPRMGRPKERFIEYVSE